MNDQAVCPGREEWQSYVVGAISEEQAALLEKHLDGCDQCLASMQTLHGEDTILEALRSRKPEDKQDVEIAKRISQRLRVLSLGLSQKSTATAAIDGNDIQGHSSEAEDATQQHLDFLAPPQSADEIGRLGHYAVLALIGTGGMGIVFKARDLQLKRLVALKVMKPNLASASAAQRFVREAQAAAAIKHDHIVTIHQVGQEGNVPFIAMEFLEGESLESRLKREKKLPMPEVRRIGREIAEALAAAHEHGLIHRDIKPGNIWLEGERGRVKILDFGLARAGKDDANLTSPGAVLGTPAYMAPEQGRGEKVDARADLFSLGCVLYRMTTSEQAFKGNDMVATLLSIAADEPKAPHFVNGDVPTEISDLIMQLLEKSPERRPASGRVVVNRIAAFLDSEKPQGAKPPHSRRPRSRWPMWTGLMAACLFLPLFLFGGQIVRFATNKGELIIDVQDPNYVVSIQRNNVLLRDKANEREFTLEVGDGEILVFEKDGFGPVATKKFSLNRGGKTTVTVTFQELADGKALASDKQKKGKKDPESVVSGGPIRLGPIPAGPSPFDALRREDIPAYEMMQFGGAGPKGAPTELVAVLGGSHAKHWTQVKYLAYSPKGKWFASSAADGVRVWDAVSGEQKHHALPSGVASPIAFVGENELAYCARRDQSEGLNLVVLLDLGSGKRHDILCDSIQPRATVGRMSFSLESKLLAFSLGNCAVLLDVEKRKTQVIADNKQRLREVALSIDGKKLAVLKYEDNKIQVDVWDVGTQKLEKSKAFDSRDAAPGGIAFDPSGRNLVVTGAHLLWDWQNDSKTTISLNSPPSCVAFHPNGTSLAIGSDAILLIDPATGKQQNRVLIQRISSPKKKSVNVVTGVAWSPDGKTLACLSTGSQAIFFDTGTWEEKSILPGKRLGHNGKVVGLAVTPDGKTLISSGSDGSTRLWDIAQRKERVLHSDPRIQNLSLALTREGRKLAVGQSDGQIKLWDMVKEQPLAAIVAGGVRYPNYQPSHLAFSSEGKLLVCGPGFRIGSSPPIRVFDMKDPTGEPKEFIFAGKKQNLPTTIVQVAPDGTLVGAGHYVQGWNIATGAPVVLPGLENHFERLSNQKGGGYIERGSLSADGNCLAYTVSNEERLYILNGKTNAPLVLNSRKNAEDKSAWTPSAMTFSPNSHLLAYRAGTDIYVIDSRSGVTQRTIRLRPEIGGLWQGEHLGLAFAPDGRHLISANPNGTIYVFRLAPPGDGKEPPPAK